MNKTISVIIPNYNKGLYIEDCIRSVISQTYDYIDVIIVDDCSTDDSIRIIKNYCAIYKNIHLIELKNNVGVSKARNIGVNYSNADYVTFLDSDDVYLNKEKITNEIQIADDYCIAYSQYVFMTQDGIIKDYVPFSDNLYEKDAIVDILALSKPCDRQLRGYVFSRKLFYEVGGYSNDMCLYEDLDLLCRLALKSRFVYTGEIGEGYRLNTGGLSSVTVDKAKDTIQLIRNKYIKRLSLRQRIKYNYSVGNYVFIKKTVNLCRDIKRCFFDLFY